MRVSVLAGYCFIMALVLGACSDSSDGVSTTDEAMIACDLPAEDIPIRATEAGIEYVRTPDACFEALVDFPYTPNYALIEGLRMHYVDVGPQNGEVVLMLHGQPSWSYLYRKMIPVLVESGYRVIAADHIGMGRSDKPVDPRVHTYEQQVAWNKAFIAELGLTDITLFVQDWGSLIGLRVAGDMPELFARIVIANGDLPPLTEALNPFTVPVFEFDESQPDAFEFFGGRSSDQIQGFQAWIDYAASATQLFAADVVQIASLVELSDAELAAYNAPFPDPLYWAAIRAFPSMIAGIRGETLPALEALERYERPFLALAGRFDPNLGSEATQNRWIESVPGAVGQNHRRYDAGHFIQEDVGAEMAADVVTFMQQPAMASGPLELTQQLCEDPDNMALLMASSDWERELSASKLNPEQVERMVAEPTRGPFYMLNLIRYREQAEYEDGRETDLTGREANELYQPLEFLSAIGAEVVFYGAVDTQIDGDDILWDDVAIVEYPCPAAFFAMSLNPDFQARIIHKNAGVENTIVMVTHLEPSSMSEELELSEPVFPSMVDDPAFEWVQVLDFNDIAQYEEGANEPERSGAEAWAEYQAVETDALQRFGSRLTARLIVQGTLVGYDERSWDEAVISSIPSTASFEALLDDEERQASDYHRLAALANNYSMVTYPFINSFSDDSNDTGGGGGLPITESGVGTICSSDADCVGIGFCLSDGNGPGFCSRMCGAGECGDAYLCCHSCSEMAAPLLPFSESACMVEAFAGSLSAAPISCSCE